MKLKNLQIEKKLVLGVAMPLILSTALLVLSIAQSINQVRQYRQMLDKDIKMQTVVLECRDANDSAARIVRDIVLDTTHTNLAQSKAAFEEKMKVMDDSIAYIRAEYTLKDGLDSQYITAIQNWQQAARSTISLASSMEFQKAYEDIVQTCGPALAELAKIANAIDTSVSNYVSERRDSLENFTSLTLWTMIGISVMSLIFVIIFSKALINSIIQPTNQIHKAILAMSEGKLNTKVDYESEDELGEMAEALRTSQSVLSKACTEISDITTAMADGKFNVRVDSNLPGEFNAISVALSTLQQKMNSMISGVKRSVEQVSSGAEQVANGSQALAQGATEQASAVEQLSASINDIAESARQNAEAAGIARQNADQAGEQNISSQNQMKEMISAMDDITEKSKEISKIIKTIEDIAFQTNILALNAAVEAARAGSAGKGFAVVADEVRNLATKSSEAAKDTTTLIEDSIRAVERGSSIAHSAADSITISTELTSQAVEKIAQIAQTAEHDSEAIAQVTQGIDQIATVVQTNSATSEESAAASEELSSQANVMRKIFASFQVEEDDMNSFNNFDTNKSDSGSFGAGGSAPMMGSNFPSEYQYDDSGKY